MGFSTCLFLLLAAAGPEDDLASELPRIAPKEPGEALASFRIHDGFRLKPVASEPLVSSPVDVCYDEDGRLYVVEMRGYPYPEDSPTGRVVRLEDVDGDGVFDTSTVFLDGLNWPTAVCPWAGGVFVAAAPDLLYAKDTDGDGRADERRVSYTGFGHDNVQALFNGLIWGPDGWIYGNGSSNGGTITSPAHPNMEPIELGRRDFRFKPDGSAFEPISGGGQFGHTFDDWGHRFTCSNSNHLRQIVLPSWYLARNPDYAPPSPVVDIPAEGPAAPVFRISEPEPWRIVRTRQRAADPEFRARLPATELVATGFFTSATGVTIYRGSAFPPEFQGNAFIGDVGGNLVHRKRLEPDGAIFKAVRADEGVEFLASTDNWFRPVNFENTPDGTLLIIDMYRETIEHPWSIPEPIKQHLDLTSGKDRGRLYLLEPEGFEGRRKPKLSTATDEELVALLADPDAWWRETAQRLLIERGDEIEFGRGGRELGQSLIRLALERPNPLARLHSLWTLAALRSLPSVAAMKGLQDPHPYVRERSLALAEWQARDDGVRGAMLGLANDSDPSVRFQAAFSLGEVSGPQSIDALARLAASDADSPWIRAAVLSSVHGRAVPMLEAMTTPGAFGNPRRLRPFLRELAEQVGAGGGEVAARELAAEGADLLEGPDRIEIATAVLGGARRSGRDLALWLAPGSPTGPPFAALFAEAEEQLMEDRAEAGGRDAAIGLLAFAPADRAVPALSAQLVASRPGDVQLQALRSLNQVDASAVGPAILGAWRSLAPGARREAIEVLLARPDRIAALLDALETGDVAPADIDPARLAALAKSSDTSVRDRATAILDRLPARPDRRAVLEAYRPALADAGRTENGREVFTRVCATCHQAEGAGKAVGPALATVAHRSPEDLLIHILDPNREVLPAFLNYAVALEDGRTLTGQIAEETPGTITLKRAEGQSDVVARDQIEEMASSGLSLMPEGLEKDIDPAAMADLIAFIRGLKPE